MNLLTIYNEPQRRTTIVSLFCFRSPFAIFWSIISVVVNSLIVC